MSSNFGNSSNAARGTDCYSVIEVTTLAVGPVCGCTLRADAGVLRDQRPLRATCKRGWTRVRTDESPTPALCTTSKRPQSFAPAGYFQLAKNPAPDFTGVMGARYAR